MHKTIKLDRWLPGNYFFTGKLQGQEFNLCRESLDAIFELPEEGAVWLRISTIPTRGQYITLEWIGDITYYYVVGDGDERGYLTETHDEIILKTFGQVRHLWLEAWHEV